MQLLLLVGAAALRLRQEPAPADSCVGACAGAREEVASARFTQCWHACELPTGDAARTGDVQACLASCVNAGATAELDGDDWLRADEHAKAKAEEEMRHQRFDGFWDKACEAGMTEACRTVPEHVAKLWLRIEVHVNATREEGRQWLLRQPEAGFAAGMERLNADLAAVTLANRNTTSRAFVRLYLWKKENPGSSAEPDLDSVTGDLEPAAAELSSETEKAFKRAQTLLLKELAERRSERELEEHRAEADKTRARAEKEAASTAAKEEWTDEQKAAEAASIRSAWRAAHEEAAEAHDKDVREEFEHLDIWWERGEEFRESLTGADEVIH